MYFYLVRNCNNNDLAIKYLDALTLSISIFC